MEKSRGRILVILTGGTICSAEGADGKRFSNAKDVKIIEAFKKGQSPYRDAIDFTVSVPLDILSENMTVESWDLLLAEFRKVMDSNVYNGIIVLHGTDTLAYTASMLAVVLAGSDIPVCLVSSQLPLHDEKTNGHENFRTAAEIIMKGIAPNVYVVYRNSDGQMLIHYGAHLSQCRNYSEDFFSADAICMDRSENACPSGRNTETASLLIGKIQKLTPCVLYITPYVGINYDSFHLDGVRAVVHGTFHSETVCVERRNGTGAYTKYSVLHLIDRCAQENIPVFLAPCSAASFKYESTGDALKKGAYYIEGTTPEMAYIKTLIGCALNYSHQELVSFVNTSINWEHIYKPDRSATGS